MWITHTNDATKSHWSEDVLGELVEDPYEDLPGDARGIACDEPVQVPDDVGEALVAHYEHWQRYEADTTD